MRYTENRGKNRDAAERRRRRAGMKRNAGWMLLAALCVLLCACRAQRSAVPAAAAGRYSGESVCIYGGERTPMDEVYSGESYLEIGRASCRERV